MAIGLRGGALRTAACGAALAALVATWLLPPRAHAADIGGYLADQQKARALAAEKASSEACPQLIARAATDDTALAAYRAAVCYLQAETPDVVAAKAWLARASEGGFMPAQRLLRSLLLAEAGVHSPIAHCHVLGEGQQLCHGGTAAPPLAAAATR
jgi:TPR repeat protein